MLMFLDILHLLALSSHLLAAYSGILVFAKYQDLLCKVSTHETFSFKGIINNFMARRLYIIGITTMTCVLFSVKLLESFTKRDLEMQELQFFFEWAAIDILAGVALCLLHVDMLKDKRRRTKGEDTGEYKSE